MSHDTAEDWSAVDVEYWRTRIDNALFGPPQDDGLGAISRHLAKHGGKFSRANHLRALLDVLRPRLTPTTPMGRAQRVHLLTYLAATATVVERALPERREIEGGLERIARDTTESVDDRMQAMRALHSLNLPEDKGFWLDMLGDSTLDRLFLEEVLSSMRDATTKRTVASTLPALGTVLTVAGTVRPEEIISITVTFAAYRRLIREHVYPWGTGRFDAVTKFELLENGKAGSLDGVMVQCNGNLVHEYMRAMQDVQSSLAGKRKP